MLDAEPRDAIAIVFDALGATNRAATALDDVVVSALGREPRADLAVLLPPFGAWDPPGRIDDGTCTRSGSRPLASRRARELLVVCDAGSAAARHGAVPVVGRRSRPVQGIDPEAGFHVVRVEHGGRRRRALDARGVGRRRSRSAGARSRTRSPGASRTMLDLARDARARSGSSSAGRSRRSKPSATGSPTRSSRSRRSRRRSARPADEPNALTAALAKATAGRTARTVAAHCQQVLAGIGFTTDHPFHRFLKRTMLLEGLFGSADEIALDLGRQLLAARRVPTLIEL